MIRSLSYYRTGSIMQPWGRDGTARVDRPLTGVTPGHTQTRARPKLPAINNRRPGLAPSAMPCHRDLPPLCHWRRRLRCGWRYPVMGKSQIKSPMSNSNSCIQIDLSPHPKYQILSHPQISNHFGPNLKPQIPNSPNLHFWTLNISLKNSQ